jgi:hypothetical protein
MKTIFTLLFSMAMFSTTFAQYGQNGQRDRNKDNDVYTSNDNRGYDHHDRNYGGYTFTPRERDMQIAQINREYDYKMQSVKNKPFMGWFQKKRIINNLEAQRDEEIAQVIQKFRSPKNKFDDYDRRDRKRW